MQKSILHYAYRSLSAFAFLGTLLFLPSLSCAQQTDNYSFIVAGHTYGSHQGTNVGLYPKFLEALRANQAGTIDFMVLAGDIVRESNAAAWQQVRDELEEFTIPTYFVMGNHDLSDAGINAFVDAFGDTYYSFQKASELFIVLDCQRNWGRITPEQIAFLKKKLASLENTKNVFIFFHELLWTAQVKKYLPLQHNFGTYNGRFTSNFWTDLFPLIKDLTDHNFYLIAGDVGGNPGVAPAFYEKLGHITLLATGMGEVPEENFLKVTVNAGNVDLKLIPLDPKTTLKPLTEYSLENLQ